MDDAITFSDILEQNSAIHTFENFISRSDQSLFTKLRSEKQLKFSGSTMYSFEGVQCLKLSLRQCMDIMTSEVSGIIEILAAIYHKLHNLLGMF